MTSGPVPGVIQPPTCIFRSFFHLPSKIQEVFLTQISSRYRNSTRSPPQNFLNTLPFALDGREGRLPEKIKCQPLDKHWCSIVELSGRRAAGSVHLHFPPTIVSFDTQHRPRSLPPSVPSRGCVWRAMPGGCCCFGCIVHTSAVGMVKDRTGRWRGCPVGNTRAVGLPLGLGWPPKMCNVGALDASGRVECFPGVW